MKVTNIDGNLRLAFAIALFFAIVTAGSLFLLFHQRSEQIEKFSNVAQSAGELDSSSLADESVDKPVLPAGEGAVAASPPSSEMATTAVEVPVPSDGESDSDASIDLSPSSEMGTTAVEVPVPFGGESGFGC